MNKRIQTSIEFVILLTCVSTLSLSGILLFKSLETQGSSAVSAIANKTLTAQTRSYVPVSTGSPYLNIYFPENSTLGTPNRMQIDAYGCDSGHAQINISSNSLTFSRTKITANLTGISVENVSFEPLQAGPATGSVTYTMNCGSTNDSGSYPLWTYATYRQQSPGQQDDYAVITARNESLLYRLLNLGGIYNFTTFNHCTFVNFWTVPYSADRQCYYDTGASDYLAFDGSCLAPDYPYSRAYCDVPDLLNYNISQLNSSYSLDYSFKLTLQTALGLASANLTSASQNSTVYSNGQAIGTASVSESYAPSYLPQQIIVQGPGQAYSYGNATAYSQYEQAYDSLNDLLQFYNNAEISGDSQASIQVSLYAVSTSSSAFLRSLTGITGSSCEVNGGVYRCPSKVPFTYQINVNLPGLEGQNESLNYAGTLVRIN